MDIEDYRSLVTKIYDLRKKGDYDKTRKLLPKEKIYQVPEGIKKTFGIDA